MIIIRNTFTAKPGQGSKLAKLMKRAFSSFCQVRVLTDLVSSFNTVQMEMSVENLSEFEKMLEDFMAGRIQFDAEVAEEMKNYTDLWISGKREVFKVLD